MIHPLDDNRALIDLLRDVSGEPWQIVAERLLAEERCIGTNVRRDLQAAGVTPHVWSDDLVRFYRTTKSFLYETSVWNRAPLKLKMRNWLGQFLMNAAPDRQLNILSFGDGLGFDSVYLSAAGHNVTYYEMADESIALASKVFKANNRQIQVVQNAETIPSNHFDVVIAMDVLEHVPSPSDSVRQFASWLRPGGWLITHSPFFFTSTHRVTHLASNRRFSGSFRLFSDNGLYPYDGRFFWDPIVVVKGKTPQSPSLLTLRTGGFLLKVGRYFNPIHCAIAQTLSNTHRQWGDDLQSIIDRGPDQ